MKLSRKHLWITGLAVIVVTNVVALAGVAYNRSGEPESRVSLSERELRPRRVWHGKEENSGLDLKLQWRVLLPPLESADVYGWSTAGYGGAAEWLDEAKMRSLGFDASLPDSAIDHDSAYGRQLSRDVLLVLEVDGPTYRQSLERATRIAEKESKTAGERAKRAQELLDEETRFNSRLFVVDAGLDLEALRAKYPDRTKYAIVAGRVRPERGMQKTKGKRGSVSDVNIDTINVPLQWRAAFEGATPHESPRAQSKTRYEVAVAFGRRLEPWIAAAQRKAP